MLWRYIIRIGYKAVLIERKYLCWAKSNGKARLGFAKKYAKLTTEDWDNILFTDDCLDRVSNIFSITLIQKTTRRLIGAHSVSLAFQVKQSAKMMVWGVMTGRRLTKLHMLHTGKTLLHRQTVYSQGWRDSTNPQNDQRAEKATALAWKNVTSDPLKKLAHSMPRCLENVIANKRGGFGY